MRILVISDVHSNWPALRAIDETFDVCLFLGDLVDYGPAPKPCIDWAREHVGIGIRGNHDHGLGQRIKPRGYTDYGYLAGETRELAWQELDEQDLQYVARLPVTHASKIDGRSFYLVHATPRDPLDESVAADPEAWARRLGSLDADFVCVGHTHVPFELKVNGTTVLNPGSVGQPRDGDCRASYAIIEDGRVQLRRIEYPIEETLRLISESPLPERAKAIATSTLRHGGRGVKGRLFSSPAMPRRPIPTAKTQRREEQVKSESPRRREDDVPAVSNAAGSEIQEQQHKRSLEQLQSEVKTLRAELEQSRAREDALIHKLEAQRSLASQLETLRAEAEELRASKRDLAAQLESRQRGDLERLQSFKALEIQASELRQEKERLFSELHEQHERRAALIQEKEVDERAYARSLEFRDSEMESLRAELDELRARERDLMSRLEAQQRSQESAQAELQSALEQFQDVLERLRTEDPADSAERTGWRFKGID